MIKKNEIYLKWIIAAYQEFALDGTDMSLKSLSNKSGLSRSIFYYHFDDKEHLISELLDYHVCPLNYKNRFYFKIYD